MNILGLISQLIGIKTLRLTGVISARSKRGVSCGKQEVVSYIFYFLSKTISNILQKIFQSKYQFDQVFYIETNSRGQTPHIGHTQHIKDNIHLHFIAKLLCESNPLNCQTWSRTNNHNLGKNGILLSTFKIQGNIVNRVKDQNEKV